MTARLIYLCRFSVVVTLFLSMDIGPAFADARVDYLLDMLKNGKNYRLREQAATTLGKLRCEEAVPALVDATRDSHELVIISAAIALKQIGDSSVVEKLEESLKQAPTKASKSQIKTTIAALRGMARKEGPEGSIKKKPRFLVRVDAMGNSSGEQRYELVDFMKEYVTRRVDEESDVLLQSAGMVEKDVREKVKRDNLAGYILSGSIIRLERFDDSLVVKVGLNVFTNPDYNLLMMPTTEATMTIDQPPGGPEEEKKELTRAIEVVADSLISEVFKSLRRADL